MLYLVPTPVGNLSDFTERAREVLSSVDLVLAEDTRTTGRLLQHYSLSAKLASYHAHNEHARVDGYVQRLLDGETFALVSDAGTPAISDPGYLLVRACRESGIAVTCLPGPTAFVPALAMSGLPCDRFFFEGFLPQKKGRKTRLDFLASLTYTFVLYESPHRLVKCLTQLVEVCGQDRQACVAREISKLHEDVKTDSLQALLDHYSEQPKVKGEIVLVVTGSVET